MWNGKNWGIQSVGKHGIRELWLSPGCLNDISFLLRRKNWPTAASRFRFQGGGRFEVLNLSLYNAPCDAERACDSFLTSATCNCSNHCCTCDFRDLPARLAHSSHFTTN